jgi:hypothetical protein
MNRPKETPRAAHERPACFEPLEGRLLLAGDVTAALSDGNLLIVGDDRANDIVLDQLAEGELRLSSGADATGLNDGAEPLVFSGVTGNVVIRLGRGDDVVLVTGLDLAGKLLVDGGDGSNTLTVDDTSIASDLLFRGPARGGGGTQTFELRNGSVVDGHVKVHHTRSDGVTTVDGATIGGSLHVQGRHGSETVDLLNSIVGGHVKIFSGHGDATVNVDGVDVGLDFFVQGRHGDADVTLLDLTARHAKVFNHKGNTSLLADGLDVEGQLFIKNNHGRDDVSVQNAEILGHLKVHNGQGDSTTLLDNVVVEEGSLWVHAKKGVDTVSLLNATVAGHVKIATQHGGSDTTIDLSEIGGNLHVHGKKGADTVTVTGGTTLVGETKIHTGQDDDLVVLDDVTATGAVKIHTAQGADTVAIEANGLPDGPASWFQGDVRIDTGTDDDSITIGAVEDGNSVVFDAAVLVNGGSGTDTLDWLDHGFETDGVVVVGVETIT